MTTTNDQLDARTAGRRHVKRVTRLVAVAATGATALMAGGIALGAKQGGAKSAPAATTTTPATTAAPTTTARTTTTTTTTAATTTTAPTSSSSAPVAVSGGS